MKILNKVSVLVPASDTKKYWQDLTKEVKNPSLHTDDDISISVGASTKTQTLKQLEQLGHEYFDRCLLKSNFLCFPPIYEIEDEATKDLLEWFKTLLNNRYISEGKGVILVAPNLPYHEYLVKGTDSKPKTEKSDEASLLIFIEEISLILVVRTATKAEDIDEEILKCQKDMQHLLNSHSHEFKEEEAPIISGIISCPSIAREDLQNMLPFHFADIHKDVYNTSFLCKDDLDGYSGSSNGGIPV